MMHLTKSQITLEIKSIKHKKEARWTVVYEMDGESGGGGGAHGIKHRKSDIIWYEKLWAIGISPAIERVD